MQTWHLHITGQVQGVGFRPFVYAQAIAMQLTGMVNNGRDGVHVWFNSDPETAHRFADRLCEQLPRMAILTGMHLKPAGFRPFADFQIVHSDDSGPANLMIAPDFALCKDCREELREESNRRAGYPFITCTQCGPRYGIMEALPYDRVHTSMDAFRMCPTCVAEYENPTDRRYYSQTNSCPDCSITLSLKDRDGAVHGPIRDRVIQAWQSGKIVAIKGTGGFLLTCDARQSAAIQILRKRKARPEKPLALMHRDPARLESCYCSPESLALMEGPEAPIVLVPVAPDFAGLPDIAPGLQHIGLMRAHNPLFQWLLDAFEGPIVATSGNLSGQPIVFRDSDVAQQLYNLADLILTHNRKIVVPQDDSVVRFSPFRENSILLRRARGYAPTYLQADLRLASANLLAMGAQAKSTFALQMDERCYVSPFLGNLDSYDTQQNYHLTMDHLCGLLHMVPDRILCDAHPDYASTHVAQQMAYELQLPLESVPHHLAHFSAVLAEHGLWSAPDSVLGVIWDGAGMGTDGQIWGGEFFGYANFHFERIGHIGYFDVLAGDKMAREPRLAAFALCHQLPEAQSLLRSMFAEPEWKVYTQWSRRKSPVQTSSVGRLFDATAALLGVSHKQTWEGSAATLLEELAINYCKNHPMEQLHAYPIATDPDGNIATAPLFSAIIHDLLQGESPARIAANFHVSLVVLVQQFARQQPFRRIAFSGGVFQNGLLCDLLRDRLEADYQLYFHHQLPPNDENIAFGQLVYHHISNNRQAFLNLKSPKYVLSNSR